MLPINDADTESRSSWAEDAYHRCCSKKVLYKRIPVLNLLANYERNMIMSDLVAGITVGLTMIPQAIAYANVAGLPPQVSSFSLSLSLFEMVRCGVRIFNFLFYSTVYTRRSLPPSYT